VGFKKFLSLNITILKMKINLPDKLYYSIGEVAKAFDVNTSLIRYWEQEFLSLSLKRTKKATGISLRKTLKIYRYLSSRKRKRLHFDGAKIALTPTARSPKPSPSSTGWNL
jgi:hypothetical protein